MDGGRDGVFRWEQVLQDGFDCVKVGLIKIGEFHACVCANLDRPTRGLKNRDMERGSLWFITYDKAKQAWPLGRFIFWLEWLCGELAVCFFQEDFHAPFGFFELLLAFARKLHALLEKLHRLVERKVRAFQSLHDFFQPKQGPLEVTFSLRVSRLV